MTTHTPGPWKVDADERSVIAAPNGEWVAQVITQRHLDEKRANAKLIAAAPNLLAALEDIAKNHYPECSCPTPECEMTCTNGVARAAIAATQ